MEKSICKIYKKDGNKGTGFFCEIPYQQGKIKVNNNKLKNDLINLIIEIYIN